MGRLFDISVEILKKEEDDKGIAIVSLYEHFMLELKNKYFAFIESVENECRYFFFHMFHFFTFYHLFILVQNTYKILGLNLRMILIQLQRLLTGIYLLGSDKWLSMYLIFLLKFLCTNYNFRYDQLEATPEQTMERVNSIMNPKKPAMFEGER